MSDMHVAAPWAPRALWQPHPSRLPAGLCACPHEKPLTPRQPLFSLLMRSTYAVLLGLKHAYRRAACRGAPECLRWMGALPVDTVLLSHQYTRGLRSTASSALPRRDLRVFRWAVAYARMCKECCVAAQMADPLMREEAMHKGCTR
jgi:uncharacterized protein YbaA (DUF1428 family)